MNDMLTVIASTVSGFIGAMGLGGGAVLIIFLRLLKNTDQFTAQGINLLFFVPVALAATVINTVKKRLCFTTVLPLCTGGLLGVAAGFYFAGKLGVDIISRLFGGIILYLGIKEIIKGIKTMLARKKK